MEGDLTELIARLATISPMPDDDDPKLTVDRLREYETIIREVESVMASSAAPDVSLLAPLLASFGVGDAFGLSWSALHLLERFPAEILRPALRQAILSGERGTRYWATYMLGRHRNREDAPVLAQALEDLEEEVRYIALLALAMVGDPVALPAMERLLDDPAPRVRKAAQKWTEHLRLRSLF
jgi:HEAT repeat protein